MKTEDLDTPESLDPSIARYVRRFPELRESVAAVLERGAEVRQARALALGALSPEPTSWPSAPHQRAEATTVNAIEALEELTRRKDAGAEEVLSAARAVAAGFSRMRAESHSFAPRRKTSSPAARTALFTAIAGFRRAFDRLARAAAERRSGGIPWQLELASHWLPGAPVSEMTLWGHDLPGTPAALREWGERCFISGVQYTADSRARPAARYRSLDASFRVLAPAIYDLVTRVRSATGALAARFPAAERELAAAAPWLWDDYAQERWHPSFERLGLLDFPALAVSLNNLLLSYAERPCLGARDEGRAAYSWLSYERVRALSLRLAHGFERLGLQPGSRLGILAAQSCPEHYLADFAAVFGNLVSMGLHATFTDDQLQRVVARSRLEAVVCDAGSLPRLLETAFLAHCPTLRLIVVFGGGGGDEPAVEPGPRIVSLERLVARDSPLPRGWRGAAGVGQETGILFGDAPSHHRARREGIAQDGDDDLYTVVLTSGSTALPKGVVVQRRRWVEEIRADSGLWPYVGVSFQPAALAADRIQVWRTLYNGGRVGFARNGATLLDDIRAIRPTKLGAPPLVWNALYREYKHSIDDPELTTRQLVEIEERFRDALGGRVASLAVGGAPSDPGVRRVLEKVLGVAMVESYGTTETGYVAADGRFLPGVDYRLVDVPELGYSAGDTPHPRGELAVKTPGMTVTYLEDEAATSRSLTEDGYFLTGDIVELRGRDRFAIIGRRKEFFKLADSRFVSPAALERRYSTSDLVDSILITCPEAKEAIVAVVVPSENSVTEDRLLAEFRAIANRAELRPAEIPLAAIVEKRIDDRNPWMIDDGLTTASSKLDRRALSEKYRDPVAAAYDEAVERRRGASDPLPADGSTRESTRSRLVTIAAALLGRSVDEIDDRLSFVELGGDSVTSMEFALRLESFFAGKGARDLGLDPQSIVGRPLARVADRLATSLPEPATSRRTARAERRERPQAAPPAGTPDAPSRSGWSTANADANEAPLSESHPGSPPESQPESSSSDHVLLTGGTGFLGAHLLYRLAVELPPAARVYALVRASDDAGARDRVSKTLARLDLGGLEVGVATDRRPARIVAIAGQLDRPRLGLPEKTFDLLAESIGLIYHVAADVDFAKSYLELRDSNVLGTHRVLELATTRTSKALHFVSSLNVAQLIEKCTGRRTRESSPLPAELPRDIFDKSLGYAVSKWVGERMVQRLLARSGGASKISVSRPGLITWSGETGVAPENDWLTLVLRSCLEVGYAIGPDRVAAPAWVPETPVSARGLDLVPVDFVARAIARLGDLTLAGGVKPSVPGGTPTFHVSNLAPESAGHVTVMHLMDRLCCAVSSVSGDRTSLRRAPFAEWALKVRRASAPAAAVLAQLVRMSPEIPRTEARLFADALRAPGRPPVPCPAIDQKLLEAFVRGHARVSRVT